LSCVELAGEEKQFITEVFTRAEFNARQYKDIIALVEFIENLSFPKAMKRICQICDIDYYHESIVEDKPKILTWLDFVETGINKENEDHEKIEPIPQSILEQFVQRPVKKWLDEGITYSSQVKYNIGFDNVTERITIPIYEEGGDLVGIKGRLIDDRKINDDKYIYIYSCPKNKILYGLHRNDRHIMDKQEVIVLEGEKSVIKLNGYGYKNAIAIGSKSLSRVQAEKLLRLNVPITLALDSDVSDEEIQKIIKELQYPIPMTDIYVLRDEMGFMGEKESPPDNIDTFNVLYNNFKIKV
jgi:DNA primase